MTTSQKPLVCFLFSGQIRSSPFKMDVKCHLTKNRILNSYRRFLLSDDFQNKYRFIVFFSTDKCNSESILNYFGKDHIGNIHMHGNDSYLYDIQHKIPPVDFFLKNYNQQNFGTHRSYPGSIHQYYKVLDCYNLFRNSEWYNKTDFVVRVRLDTIFKTSVFDALTTLESDPKLQIIVHWDWFALGRPNVMEMYCTTLENKFGTYMNTTKVPEKPPIMEDYNSLEMKRWMYAPERQLFEAIFEWCNNQHMNLFEAINYTETKVEILRVSIASKKLVTISCVVIGVFLVAVVILVMCTFFIKRR